MKFSRRKRTTGLRTTSTIFGFMPRETIRKDYCSATALAYENPAGHRIICDFAKTLSHYYKDFCPDMFTTHDNLVQQKIRPDWVIEGSPFTSGVVNKNNLLKYHFDGGNIKHVFSNMVCFKQDSSGGMLAIPEFDLLLEIANKSVLFFDGQAIMHGVTPFRINSVNGYRFTLVYYSLQQMWHCQPINEELARIKNRKTDREILRYKRLVGAELTEDEKQRSNLS